MIFVVATFAEKVLAPVNVCVPLRCAVSESKLADDIVVPFQTPLVIVPSSVISKAFILAFVSSIGC